VLDPIVKAIEVPCSQEKAFRVFVNEMGSWWPLDKFTTSAMRGAPAKSIRVEAKQGGNIVEIGSDDTETSWGTIKSYDPHGFVSMHFHIPQPDEQVQDGSDPLGQLGRSLVEVRFIAIGDDQTRVELTQSNWEAFGDMAEALRGGYGGGWVMIFEQAYKSACGG